MKNKRAYMFMLLLAIFTGVVVTAGLIAFSLTKNTSKEMLTPVSGLTQLYNDGNKFTTFAKEAAKISLAQAYYDSVYPIPLYVGGCPYDAFNKQYIELCSFSQDVYDKFTSAIKDNLKGLMEEYPDPKFKGVDYKIEIKDNIVNFKADKKDINYIGKEYSADYSFDPSFSIKLDDIGITDFRVLYDAPRECKRINEARKYSKDELREVEACVKSKIQYAKMVITDNLEKIMFDIKSKDFFLKDDAGNAEYKPIFLYIMVSKSDVTK